MDKATIKKIQMGFISLSAVMVLGACGNGGTEDDAPMTEEPVEEPAPAPEEDTGQDDAAQDDATQDDAAQDDTTGEQDQTAPDTSAGIYNVEFQVTLDDAIQTFYDTFGEEVTIDQIEFDADHGEYEYNISGWDQENEYDLDVNADTGEVTEQDTERDDDQDDTLDLDNIMTPQEAMEIAVGESGSEVIEEWTLEEEDGLTVYEIDVENGDDITIDATTGDVVDR